MPHAMLKLLLEPYPDALLMELVLAGSGHHQPFLLFKRFLADATVSLVSEFESLC